MLGCFVPPGGGHEGKAGAVSARTPCCSGKMAPVASSVQDHSETGVPLPPENPGTRRPATSAQKSGRERCPLPPQDSPWTRTARFGPGFRTAHGKHSAAAPGQFDMGYAASVIHGSGYNAR